MARDPEIVVYWRPGCGFCSALIHQLEANRVPHRRVNIWEDLRGAATVRAAARGNETVPTVAVGAVTLVNPGLDDVLAVAVTEVPEAVPDGWAPRPPGRLGAWIRSKLEGSSGSQRD
ncbi:MAG: glutaredoxin domain-containing protein [Ilumatobacteraceae bacterium]